MEAPALLTECPIKVGHRSLLIDDFSHVILFQIRDTQLTDDNVIGHSQSRSV
ncbi:hypothetical protein JJB98_29235 [Bradyrhizobium diazoefficiens]|nr:hypothetical protein [Bradyrhizobium diazoefficiens]QQO23695.1 hypothetical protein JJB98_29235 [Bradyrhizobium diazoefficiens]